MTSTLLRRPRAAPPTAAVPAIEMIDVAMTYPNGKVALSDVSVTIPAGDFVFLVGPSGAGKSTFIRLLIREQVPTAGRVIVAGRDVTRLRRSQVPALRRRIGIVFQDFRLLPNKTVFENVAFALEVTGESRGEIRAKVPRLLNLVGLHEHEHHLPTQLSGGEQQRAAIARALVHDPMLLIADEPTGNLDSASAEMVMRVLRKVADDQLATLIVVTHSAEVSRAGSRRIEMRDGRIVKDADNGVATA